MCTGNAARDESKQEDGDRFKGSVYTMQRKDYMSTTSGETEVHSYYTRHLRSFPQEQDLGKKPAFLLPPRAGMKKE